MSLYHSIKVQGAFSNRFYPLVPLGDQDEGFILARTYNVPCQERQGSRNVKRLVSLQPQPGSGDTDGGIQLYSEKKTSVQASSQWSGAIHSG